MLKLLFVFELIHPHLHGTRSSSLTGIDPIGCRPVETPGLRLTAAADRSYYGKQQEDGYGATPACVHGEMPDIPS